MAVKTYTQNFESSVPAARLFKGFCVDSHNTLPKFLPDSINSIKFIHGEPAAPGSVKLVTYSAGGESICMKHKIDEIDMERFYYRYTVITESPDEKIECIVVEEKMEVKSRGCGAKIISHFHTKDDAELDDEKLKFGNGLTIKTFNIVEAYLQANPNTYS